MPRKEKAVPPPPMPNEGKNLSPKELKEFGRLGARMEGFHSHFRHEFDAIYRLADGSFERHGMGLGDFLAMAEQFERQLEFHHTIEERMFPILAKRMVAEFGDTHPDSHRQIHAGLDRYGRLLTTFRADSTAYDPAKLRAVMDSFRKVLFEHLDQEVIDLGQQNMLRYWTLDEVRRLPI